MDNYNKEKVITTNKISLTTGINETAKMALLNFSFISVSEKIFINNMNIYIYIKWIYIEQKILTVEDLHWNLHFK